MQIFQTDELGETGPNHGHYVHRTLPLWTLFMGYVMNKVYLSPVPDIDILKERIRDAFAAVTEEMLEKIWRGIE